MGATDEPIPVQRVIDHPAHWVMAPWAVTCGALAAAGLPDPALSVGRWLLSCLLSVLVCGLVWEALARVDWAPVRGDLRRSAHVPVLAVRMPYLAQSAPWRRLAAGWGSLSWWVRESLWPLAGSSLVITMLLVPLVLVVASGLERDALWVTVGLVLGALIAGTVVGASAKRMWAAPLVVGGSWLLGQAAVGRLSWRGGVVAALAAIAFAGLEAAPKGHRLFVADVAGVLMVGLLVWQRAPVSACIAGALLLMSAAIRSASTPSEALVRWSRPLWLFVILAASLAIRGA
jgi:hypothetical protein